MKTIKNIEYTTIINKSKFITNLFFVTDIDDVKNYMELIKNKYKDATHNCYGYIIDNLKKCSDDKEPSGTAGKPILECLEKNNLNYVLCIVTRYFGGIKLGTGGLFRAYTTSVMNAISNTEIYDIINGYNVNITFNYNLQKDIDNLLKDYDINDKSFNDNIVYNVDIDDDALNILNNMNIKININNKAIIKLH